jgi:hypothetical protein
MGFEGQYVTFIDRCALDHCPALDHLPDSQRPMALLSAEGASRHAKDQALLGLLAPQSRAT